MVHSHTYLWKFRIFKNFDSIWKSLFSPIEKKLLKGRKGFRNELQTNKIYIRTHIKDIWISIWNLSKEIKMYFRCCFSFLNNKKILNNPINHCILSNLTLQEHRKANQYLASRKLPFAGSHRTIPLLKVRNSWVLKLLNNYR